MCWICRTFFLFRIAQAVTECSSLLDGIYCGEPAISLHSHHVSLVQWTTRLLPVMRDPGFIPRGVLLWNRNSPVSVVSLHWWPWHDWSLWPCLRRASSRIVTRPSCRQCDNPTLSHTALLSLFHARCRSSYRLNNQGGGGTYEKPGFSCQCVSLQYNLYF